VPNARQPPKLNRYTVRGIEIGIFRSFLDVKIPPGRIAAFAEITKIELSKKVYDLHKKEAVHCTASRLERCNF